MLKLKTYITVTFLIVLFCSCGRKLQEVPHYTVSKEFKTDTVTTVNVHINNRLKLDQLLLIAAKLKTDSTQIQNLEVHYLLPGNADITAGENSYYASARYLKPTEVNPADTLKDSDGNYWRINIFGLSAEKVKTLLSIKPKEIEGKTVLGRFIDDYSHTVIIPFNDPLDKKDNLYVIELDSAARVVFRHYAIKEN